MTVVRAACTHPVGWTHTRGEARCRACGVVRFTDYGAVRPPGLPEAVTPAPAGARCADRAAASWISEAARRRRRPGPAVAPVAGLAWAVRREGRSAHGAYVL
ncbi:DUF6255 family natural product biosynthesis protein [Streptomyces albireticuli]|uniref:DUF6255 family natural product biosynthesis protein n=1 Tax=Streptomyces albireticuli TaxID=1940 RepID=UPI0035562011